MNTYIINTALGMAVISGDTAVTAFVKYSTEETYTGDLFLDRNDLLKRGYTQMETTKLPQVFKVTSIV